MTEFLIGMSFIELHWTDMAQVILLGFIGGTLSGFIGSGGAFFMTPGMMNLGVPGPIAVASNITHKFGKAMIGSKKHGEMGHVDKKLAIFMLITAAVGINIAVLLMRFMFGESGGKGAEHGAGANLYISLVFGVVLSIVSISMLRDIIRARRTEDATPSRRIVKFLVYLGIVPAVLLSATGVVMLVLGGITATLLLLALAAYVLIMLLQRLRGRVGVAWRFGLANISRRPGSSVIPSFPAPVWRSESQSTRSRCERTSRSSIRSAKRADA